MGKGKSITFQDVNRRSRFSRLRDIVQNDAVWMGGKNRPWTGEALVTPWLLEQLVVLASAASPEEVDKLIQEIQED